MHRFVLVAVFAAPLISAAAGVQQNVSGTYKSNWDEVKLFQDGSRVGGTYVCCGGGTIEGRISDDGHTLRYRWKQPAGWGMGVWDIDGTQLSGTWGWEKSDKDGGRWDLSRANSQIAN